VQQKLPENNNFYCSFKDVSKVQVKDTFQNNGWHVRKLTWSDYELVNDWSEFVLEGSESEPLLSGTIIYNEVYLEMLNRALNALSGGYVYEFYDKDKNLIFEKKKH
jgi:hypothetical protein